MLRKHTQNRNLWKNNGKLKLKLGQLIHFSIFQEDKAGFSKLWWDCWGGGESSSLYLLSQNEIFVLTIDSYNTIIMNNKMIQDSEAVGPLIMIITIRMIPIGPLIMFIMIMVVPDVFFLMIIIMILITMIPGGWTKQGWARMSSMHGAHEAA